MPKMVNFGALSENRSNSVTRQVCFKETKIGGNTKIQKVKCDILSVFLNTVRQFKRHFQLKIPREFCGFPGFLFTYLVEFIFTSQKLFGVFMTEIKVFMYLCSHITTHRRINTFQSFVHQLDNSNIKITQEIGQIRIV